MPLAPFPTAANAALPLLPRHAERVRWQRDQALTVASMTELEALLQRAAALLEGAGIRWVGGPGLQGPGFSGDHNCFVTCWRGLESGAWVGRGLRGR